MTRVLELEILGEPKPAGSKRAFPFKKADGSLGVRVSHDNPLTQDWMQTIRLIARNQFGGNQLIDGPVRLSIRFERPRPKSHFGAKGIKANAPALPTTKPDLTKLVRAIEDALKGTVWRDDSQVCEQLTQKVYGPTFRTIVFIDLLQNEACFVQHLRLVA